jgi:hypothetical protein
VKRKLYAKASIIIAGLAPGDFFCGRWRCCAARRDRLPDSVEHPAAEGADALVLGLLGAGDEVERLHMPSGSVERRDQLVAESLAADDQGMHSERDAKPLLGRLDRRRGVVEPEVVARNEMAEAGIAEPHRPAAGLDADMDQRRVGEILGTSQAAAQAAPTARTDRETA